PTDGDGALQEHGTFAAVDEAFLGGEQDAGGGVSVSAAGDVVDGVRREAGHTQVDVEVDFGDAGDGFQVEGEDVHAGAGRAVFIDEELGLAEVQGAAAVGLGGAEAEITVVAQEPEFGGGEVFGDEAGQEFEDVRWGVGGAVGVEAVLGQVEVFWDPFELAGAFKTAV